MGCECVEGSAVIGFEATTAEVRGREDIVLEPAGALDLRAGTLAGVAERRDVRDRIDVGAVAAVSVEGEQGAVS